MSLNRINATAIHLAASILVAIALIATMLLYWYPNPFITVGGYQGIKILLTIDVVLGPLLTLLIFNTKKPKKELKRDLLFILLIQISCLMGGIWLIYHEKPELQVLTNNGIHIISKADQTLFNAQTTQFYQNSSTPLFFVANLPSNENTEVIPFIVSKEFTTEKPFRFISSNYVEPKTLTRSDFTARINYINSNLDEKTIKDIPKSNKHDCLWTKVFSNHFKGFACVHRLEGIKELIKTS